MTDATLGRRAFALFDRLIDLPAEERAAQLDALCAGDAALREQVERMLAADTEATAADAGARVAQWQSAVGEALALDTGASMAGQAIGPWRVVSLLGRGGMGAVYLAQREGGDFRQRAAVKLIGLGLDSPRARDRFAHERRILAKLEHPNIATLLDGGVTDAGIPYFAMSYVEGERIDAYCDARKLDVRARVRLLLQVLDAVAFAHRQLVVHRDLKPSNILIDANGKACLLDFGISKLMEAESARTLTGDRAFTPEYASPEQLLGDEISTATDLYQLGVLLYALLARSHPYGLTGDTPLRTRIARMDGEPQPLWETAKQVSDDEAARRGSTPAQLVAQLRGDLSAIAQRCVAGDPQHRFRSVDDLRDDLIAWLDGEPVSARAPTLRYRLGRFLRRHAIASTAATVAVLALVAGLGVALWQANIARQQAARAERVKDFVLSMFREQSPLSRGGPERIPAQLLQNSIRALNREFADEPALRGELLDALGETQSNQDDFGSGRATLLQALALRQAQHGANSAEVAETERKLAVLAYRQGANAEAMQRARRVIAIWTALGNAHAPDAARAKGVLAMILADGKQRERALSLTSEALADMEAALGPQAQETIHTRFRHAVALSRSGREADAIAGLRQVIASTEAVRGADAAYLGLPLVTLANLLMDSRNFDEADRLFARAAALDRMHFGKRDNMRLANTLIQHGEMKLLQKDLPAAESLFDQAEAAMPEGALWTRAVLLRERGRLHVLRHEAAPAESSLRRAFELTRQVLGDNDGITWYVASQWGRALALQGDVRQAEAVQRDALAKQEKLLGPDDYEHALLLDALAETLAMAHRDDEAIAALQRALALTAKKYPQTHPVYRERAERLRQAQQAVARRG